MNNTSKIFEVENEKILKSNYCKNDDQNENSESSSISEKDCKKSTNDLINNESNIEIGFASIIATHYNSIDDAGYESRDFSKIKYLRNFNNWIKSMLIKDALDLLQSDRIRHLKVLDMCCGKGGDIIKWLKSNIRHLICTDIAENSLDDCAKRFKDLSQKFRKQNLCTQEIIPADCTKVRLRNKYEDPSIQLDIVSCQFSFHYCFESLPQAECMLKNAAECLKPGGLFIGTVPNANEIIKRLKETKTNVFKNSVFSVEMSCEEPYPLFGSKYNFYLEGVVNCPEFLVHFPTLVKLAKKYGLELIYKKTFDEFYREKKDTQEGKILLTKIKALQLYPPEENDKQFSEHKEYEHVLNYWEKKNYEGNQKKCQVGTLSKSEWEVATLYQTFIFKKVKISLES